MGPPSYRYVDADLLLEPTHYMYSAIEGPEFLGAYLAQRKKALASLRALGDSAALVPGEDGALARAMSAWHTGQPVAVPSWLALSAVVSPGTQEVRTAELLTVASWNVVAGITESTGAVEDWVRVLIRKFEVAKKIRAGYGADLAATDERADEVANYAMLAFLVAATQDVEVPDVRTLNVLLKLTDLLCSTRLDAGGPVTVTAAWVAVDRELRWMSGLLRRHGLPGESPA